MIKHKNTETVEKLKELRTAAGMTKRQFSELYGIPYRSYEKWERGERTPPPYVIDMIEKCEQQRRVDEGSSDSKKQKDN